MTEKVKEKLIFHTWEDWCLIKLKELGKSTLKKWATAMGYDNSGNLTKMVEKLTEAGKLNVTKGKNIQHNIYEVKDDVIF